MDENEICRWAHQVRIDPDSATALRGVDAAAHGSALLAWAFEDDPASAPQGFWNRLERRMTDEDFRTRYEAARAQLSHQQD